MIDIDAVFYLLGIHICDGIELILHNSFVSLNNDWLFQHVNRAKKGSLFHVNYYEENKKMSKKKSYRIYTYKTRALLLLKAV